MQSYTEASTEASPAVAIELPLSPSSKKRPRPLSPTSTSACIEEKEEKSHTLPASKLPKTENSTAETSESSDLIKNLIASISTPKRPFSAVVDNSQESNHFRAPMSVSSPIPPEAFPNKGSRSNPDLTSYSEPSTPIRFESFSEPTSATSSPHFSSTPSRTASPPTTPTPTGNSIDTALHILVAEDDKFNQKLISRLLSKHNSHHEVVLANNGLEALNYFTERASEGKSPFDVIFMDLEMPTMGGLEASSKIRAFETSKSQSPIRIVVMSAHEQGAYRKECNERNIQDIVCKPFQSKDLFVLLANIAADRDRKA